MNLCQINNHPPADPQEPRAVQSRLQRRQRFAHNGKFDGVIDFDAVLRDPDHPSRLLPRFASEDGLHLGTNE
jgi:hypothetical protein